MEISDRIQHKIFNETRAITRRVILSNRDQLPDLFQELKDTIPEGFMTGPPFCIIQFVSSITDGYDAELCYPVRETLEMSRLLPEMEVLSLIHNGPIEELGESYRALYAWATEKGIISDEFCLEIYLDLEGAGEVEIQFVIHPWDQLLVEQMNRVLGTGKASQIAPKSQGLKLESTVQERFDWVHEAVTGLESSVGEGECYEILSSCSHVFPPGQIAKLREVFLAAEEQIGDRLAAVDAVIDFMGEDPGWAERPRREGNIIYSSKNPRDPAGYEKAHTLGEKRKAYCFCPLIRDKLDQGMPASFCYCGAGWYRQQWEGAIGEPVSIEIISSLLEGGDHCEFAVHLPMEPVPTAK